MGSASGLSALETEAELALELDQAADGAELAGVLLAAEGGQHAGVVAEGGDQGPKAGAERLPSGPAAEIVIAACPRRFGAAGSPSPHRRVGTTCCLAWRISVGAPVGGTRCTGAAFPA